MAAINSFLNESEGGNRTIWGYDSFAGFPEPECQDESSFRSPLKGEWSMSPSGKYSYSPDFAKLIFKEAGVPFDNVRLVEGFFDETLKNHPQSPIAILHVDGDLYQSYFGISISFGSARGANRIR